MRERIRGRIATLTLAIGSVAFSLIFLEFLIRLTLPQELTPLDGWDPSGLTIYDDQLGRVLRPNFIGPWARKIIVKTNSIGLRDREYESKKKNEIRVLSLGDSYAFGYGVKLQQSYPKLVEKMLSERFPSCVISIINGAVSGYTTHQQILVLKKLRTLLDPDFVLSTFVGSNDVIENAIFPRQMKQKIKTPVGFLGQKSHLVRIFLRVSYPVRYRLSNWWGPNIDYTIERLREIVRRMETNELPYLMLIIPGRHQVRPEVNVASKWLFNLGLNSLIMRQNIAIINNFESEDVPYLDLHPILVEHDKLERVSFVDDSHTNPIGHRVMAEAIYQVMEPRIAELVGKKKCSIAD